MKVSKTSELGVDSITFTFETDEDKRAMYAIFNFTHNLRLLRNCMSDITIVKKLIGAEYYQYGTHSIISSSVTYNDYYTCDPTRWFDYTDFLTNKGNIKI